MSLDEPISNVRGVSAEKARHFAKLDILTLRDLLTHYPRRYIDMSRVEKAATARIGQACTVVGRIHELKLKKPKAYLSLVEISLVDETGILMITCFRQPWLMKNLSKNERIAVSGKIEFSYGFKRMVNPLIEPIDSDLIEEYGLIIPVHPATGKIKSGWIRKLILSALEKCFLPYDPLPLDLRLKYRLISRQTALRCIHFPKTLDEAQLARRRLVYEELLLLELYLMTETEKRGQGIVTAGHCSNGPRLKKLSQILPFELTEEQKKACKEILQKMHQKTPSNHMLLGDVGTGKTIVSAFALAAAADSSGQALMMAPTEILARQYGLKIGPLLTEIGIRWDTLTGSTASSERSKIISALKKGEIDVLFGTHALLEDEVQAKNCSLLVIDEQHRFGVSQRATLLAKGRAPDTLYMTATPIPRSLALAMYGGLSLSYLKHKPHKGAVTTTQVLSSHDQGIAFDAAKAALARGEQVYVVCPLVGVAKEDKKQTDEYEESEDITDRETYDSVRIEDETDFDAENIKAAEQEARHLQSTVFVDYKVGLLHGKMSGRQKNEMMETFASGEINVLVSTTVIEVGIDVANASLMIIQDADRFGLAQLHQLRGRVGRGSKPAEVYLVSSSKTRIAIERLEAMERIDDGFELASYDLSLRREGDILGNRQHGSSSLKLVNIVRDEAVIEAAYADAKKILSIDPSLTSDAYRGLGREMNIVFKNAHQSEGG